MTKNEFWNEINKFYKYSDQVFSEVDNYLDRISAGDRRRLCEEFLGTETSDVIKTPAKFMKVARSLNLKKVVNEKAYYYCEKCKIKFSLASKGCPVCNTPLNKLNYQTATVGKNDAQGIVPLRDDCWTCVHYEEQINPDAGRCKGPTCGGWGKGHQGGPACNECSCKKCCNEKFLQENRWEQFHAMDLAGVLEDRVMKEKRGA